MSDSRIIFSPWSYLAFTILFSWVFWIVAILLKKESLQFPTIVFYILGGLGPAVISILFVYTNQEIDRKDFWNRVYSFNRIGFSWFGIIVTVALSASLFAILIGYILKFNEDNFENVKNLFTNPILLTSTLALNIVAVFLEEIGWRGYALDHLQSNFSALSSSLILGLIWAIWHIPLFFITGTYQNQLGFNTYKFWLFMFGIIVQSILITWVFNNTNRSILAAIFLHFFVNFFGEMFDLGEKSEIARFALFFIYALLVVILFGYQSFSAGIFKS
ncbi:MAG: CPBP family intramembrane glutamic endopeptidase [Candidatus Heimdallarchaeaceae archaeon]